MKHGQLDGFCPAEVYEMPDHPGLTEEEAEEWANFLKMHIGEVTQEEWQRFNELNGKCISSLAEECKKPAAR